MGDIEVRGEILRLMPDHAVFWPKAGILALSDVHLGKAESLQGLGLPVPSGDHLADLGRIAKLIQATRPARVFILGDLIHAKRGLTSEILEALEKFLKFFEGIEFTLLMGNHERGARAALSKLRLNLVEGDLAEGPFLFSHGHDEAGGFEKVESESDLFVIQGHLHPVVKMREGSTSLRLPCFWLTPSALTLPSFGSLTGGWLVRPKKKEKVFVTTGAQVHEL